MTDDEVLQNKADREAAAEIVRLLEEEERRPRFWEALAALALDHLPRPVDVAAVGLTEAYRLRRLRRAEASFFPRGQHAQDGTPVGRVPPSYVRWWLGETFDAFSRELRWYSEQPEFRQREAAEDAQLDASKPDWMRAQDED